MFERCHVDVAPQGGWPFCASVELGAAGNSNAGGSKSGTAMERPSEWHRIWSKVSQFWRVDLYHAFLVMLGMAYSL